MSKKRLLLVLSVTLVAFLFAGSASAAWFLKIEGIEGESKDSRHPGWIELQSFSLGSLGPNELGDIRLNAARLRGVSSLKITKTTDKASPLFQQAKGSPTSFPTALLDVCRPGLPSCVRYLLHGVQVHEIKHAGLNRLDEYEEISFTYQKIEVQNMDGKTMASDDWQANQGQKGPTATPTPVPTPSKPSSNLTVAQAPVVALDLTGRITGVSAVAPAIGGLRAAVTVASTGPCNTALADFGDGSISLSTFNLTGTSTPLPVHTYSTAGLKKIRVGGRSDPGWGGPKKPTPDRKGDCTGYAETTVTVKAPPLIQAVPH